MNTDATNSMEEQIEKLIPILRKSQFCDLTFIRGKAIHGTAKAKFILLRPDEYNILFTAVMNTFVISLVMSQKD